MRPERWAVIESLYHAALEKDPAARPSWLHLACGDDTVLLREVESLLGCADASLSNPGARPEMAKLWERIAPASETGAPQPADEAPIKEVAKSELTPPIPLPDFIGRYRVLRLLGAGGMGVVYEAEQEQPRRTVALKVIQPGVADPELFRRFEQESAALGRLQHAGIAQIYEAGNIDTKLGRQPWFAMEFIRGRSLIEYAQADNRLSTRQRLDLIARICDAVHHAHQRGIIHRDLKPGNILVDEAGNPKILDFGVARVTNAETQATRNTDIGQLVGTLAYMSPEQVLADPLELDTRSDVYALGVILYELLAGRLPYRITSRLHEAIHAIREEEPWALSTVNRAYRGDIETIVAKALEKDKTRRYASAAELAADLRRYLRDEPIVARPASASYQLKKFARRNKALVLGIAAVFVVLIAGIVVSAREAARANTESAAAKAVNEFLQNDLLAQASAANQSQPGTKPDPDLKVRTALDRAAGRIAGRFDKQPLVEASIRHTIGNTYSDLGLYPEAQRQLERTCELRRRFLGERNRETLAAMHNLAQAYADQGQYARAEPLLARTLELRRRLLGQEHQDTLNSMSNLSTLYFYEGKFAQAEPLAAKVLAAELRVLGEEHRDTLVAMNNLSSIYRSLGNYAPAESLCRRALGVQTRVLGAEHPETLVSLNNLAMLCVSQGKYSQAAPLCAQALQARQRVLGNEHPLTLASMNNLATIYRDLGKYAEAESLCAKVLEVRRRVLGETHPNTLLSMNDMGLIYREELRYTQAHTLFREVLATRRRVLGEEHPRTLESMSNLAQTYKDQGDYSSAEPLLVKVVEGRRRVLGAGHPDIIAALDAFGELRLKQGRYSEAELPLREALTARENTNPGAWERYGTQSLLGVVMAGERRYAEAEPLLLSGYQGMLQRKDSMPFASRTRLKQTADAIVQLYKDWGKPDKAAEWGAKLRAKEAAPHV